MLDVRIFRNEETFRDWAIYYGPDFLRVTWWKDTRGNEFMDLYDDEGVHLAAVLLKAFNKQRLLDICEELEIKEIEIRGAV